MKCLTVQLLKMNETFGLTNQNDIKLILANSLLIKDW